MEWSSTGPGAMSVSRCSVFAATSYFHSSMPVVVSNAVK